MQTPRSASVLRFGTFEFSPQSGELRKAGVRIKVQQQPLKLLEILMEHPGELVTREELRARISPTETFGDFDQAINIAIAKLRGALGDAAETPRYIETLPRRGYRFIAQVTVVGAEQTAARPNGQSPAPQFFSFSRTWRLAGLVLGVVIAVLGVWLLRVRSRSSPLIHSLAVLPLESLSGDASQDYFADGMTDELITDLAQIRALRVISRTSMMAYKKSRRPLAEIARELKVDAVVEGTVLRSGDRIRITAQLIQVMDERHLWAHSYEGDVRDALALQNDVAHAIAEQIQVNVDPQALAALTNKKVVDPEAYEAYLKGRYFWNKRTSNGLRTAVAYFEQAIDRDPGYARAYSGLADSYALMGDWEYGVLAPGEAYPKAKAAAIHALELDSSLSEAHTSLAFAFDVFDWNWKSADQEYRRAIELNPGYATAHHWYACHLSELGRNSEAIAEIRKAESLDPLSLIIGADLAGILLVARQSDEAIAQSRKTVDMDPNFAVAHLELGQAFLQKRNYQEAIAEFQKASELSGGSIPSTANLAYAYAVSNQADRAMSILHELQSRSIHNASEIALVYAGLGQQDEAMKWLEKAYAEHFNPSILMRPAFDPLRSDRRFQDLMHRLDLLP